MAKSSSSLWRSLRHRNYRLYLTGQIVSVCGTWMQQVAQSWIVYRLTGSATLLGVVSFASQAPVFAFASIGGVMTDRYAPRRLLLWTQSTALLQAFLLALLTFTGWIHVAHVIAMAGVLGVINAFDMPARQSLVNGLVDVEDLPNAIALNSSMINAARIIGPALAGALVAKFGEGVCFLINAVSYLAVLWALAAMKMSNDPAQRSADGISIMQSAMQGVRYIKRAAPIRGLLLLMGAVGFFGMPYMSLMPVFAAEIHGGGAGILGLMMGAVGVGALTGALILARRSRISGLGKVIVSATIGFGVGLVLFASSHVFALTLVVLTGVGCAWMMVIASCNTALQVLAADEMRGRVMSLFSMMIVGMGPFGSLIAGWFADRIGADWVVGTFGLFCVLSGLAFARKLPAIRLAALPMLKARGIVLDQPHA